MERNTGLESLTLNLVATELNKLFKHFTPDRGSANSIMRVLDTLHAPNLRELKIKILCILPEPNADNIFHAPILDHLGKDINWTPLNRVLARKQFDNLQRVRVNLDYLVSPGAPCPSVEHPGVMDAVNAEIRRRMDRSLWSIRGILTLEVRHVHYELPPNF